MAFFALASGFSDMPTEMFYSRPIIGRVVARNLANLTRY